MQGSKLAWFSTLPLMFCLFCRSFLKAAVGRDLLVFNRSGEDNGLFYLSFDGR